MKVTKRLEELMHQLVGFTTMEAFKAGIDKAHPEGSPDWKYYRNIYYERYPQLKITGAGDGTCLVSMGYNGGTPIKFTLCRYPACCGALMMHHFYVDNRGWKDPAAFPLFMDEFFNTFDNLVGHVLTGSRDTSVWAGDMYANNRRIIVMMVESRGIPAQERLVDAVFEPIDNPAIIHKPLFDYFHSQKKVNTRLMYNINSGNVLHDMEVILKDKPQ